MGSKPKQSRMNVAVAKDLPSDLSTCVGQITTSCNYRPRMIENLWHLWEPALIWKCLHYTHTYTHLKI